MTLEQRGVVAVIHGEVPPGAPEDEKDVLVERTHVCNALSALGFRAVPLTVTLDLGSMVERVRALKPVTVFNLVESIAGCDALQHLAPAALEATGIAHTGASSEAIYLTTNKAVAKKIMQAAGIPTPSWRRADEVAREKMEFPPPYILKPISEDASRGISDDSVIDSEDKLRAWIERTSPQQLRKYMVEKYIDGREFNIALLAGPSGPEVLPPAEMVFVDYPVHKPTIVGFKAKWDMISFEYHHTVRRFDFGSEDTTLLTKLTSLSLRCWREFRLAGHVRVDFRVDAEGNPWVLEVNANPCLSPDSGFVAAATRAGMSYLQIIERITMS